MPAPKLKSHYVCQDCGTQSPKWVGRCPGCEQWNSMVEEVSVKARGGGVVAAAKPVLLAEVVAKQGLAESRELRLESGLTELDRVLGGGLVKGSIVMLGGEPGIGKSTLLLQAIASFPGRGLYVTGEESAEQIASRASRLGLPLDRLDVLCTNDLDETVAALGEQKPRVAIIDSLQTLGAGGLESAPGSVSQVREVAHRLARVAKSQDVAMFLVGHVNKEGSLAGPKVVEHLVDVVLYFDTEAGDGLRLLRAHKNRFGAVSEVGIFEMTESGLLSVDNPSERFLSERLSTEPGSVVTAQMSGTRTLLAEVQALCVATPFGLPRRTALGIDQNRLAMLLAVLERRAEIAVMGHDVFVNAVGGLKLNEPSADLAIALAVASSLSGRAVPRTLVAFGEVGLTGEVRKVSRPELRLEEARRLGFQRIILAAGHEARLDPAHRKHVVLVSTLREALTAAGFGA